MPFGDSRQLAATSLEEQLGSQQHPLGFGAQYAHHDGESPDSDTSTQYGQDDHRQRMALNDTTQHGDRCQMGRPLTKP
jgi:hypothetical protein